MRLILTGISQETHFSPPSLLTYLVFNNGDLKVPVSEEQAELVMEQVGPMLEQEESPHQDPEPNRVSHLVPVPPPEHDVTETEEEEDGVGQV
jgi:hypothetical protein